MPKQNATVATGCIGGGERQKAGREGDLPGAATLVTAPPKRTPSLTINY